jgi:hypothetical protein
VKTLFLLAAVASGQPQASQSLDLAAYSCREYVPRVLQEPSDSAQQTSIHIMHFWLYGYVSGKVGNTVMAKEPAAQFVKELILECGQNPGQTVLQAAETVYGRPREP